MNRLSIASYRVPFTLLNICLCVCCVYTHHLYVWYANIPMVFFYWARKSKMKENWTVWINNAKTIEFWTYTNIQDTSVFRTAVVWYLAMYEFRKGTIAPLKRSKILYEVRIYFCPIWNQLSCAHIYKSLHRCSADNFITLMKFLRNLLQNDLLLISRWSFKENK